MGKTLSIKERLVNSFDNELKWCDWCDRYYLPKQMSHLKNICIFCWAEEEGIKEEDEEWEIINK